MKLRILVAMSIVFTLMIVLSGCGGAKFAYLAPSVVAGCPSQEAGVLVFTVDVKNTGQADAVKNSITFLDLVTATGSTVTPPIRVGQTVTVHIQIPGGIAAGGLSYTVKANYDVSAGGIINDDGPTNNSVAGMCFG